MTNATKVTLEKTARPDYEGGGMAYTVFAHAVRGGKPIKVGIERGGQYSSMVAYAQKHAAKLNVPCNVCPN